MKKLTFVLLFAAISLAAQQSTAPKQQAEAQKPNGATLPANAERVSENVWRAKGPDGKTYRYTNTPFGMIKQDEAEGKQTAPRTSIGIKAKKIEGDEITFERNTPFGRVEWKRNKSELTVDEKIALEEYAAAKPASKTDAAK